MFRGAPVERLAKSDIVIWNSGRTTIKGDSIVCSDPLRISFEDTCHVLQVRPLRTSRVVINFKADIAASRANEVLLSFDYLDHGDGVWLEIVHTSEKAPIVQGSIMGIPEGVCCRGSIAPHLAYARASRIRLLFLIITVAFLLLSVGSVIKSVSLTPFFWIFQVYIAMCIYIVGELLSRVARVVTLRELPSRLISPYPPPVRLPILEEESRLGLSSEQTERC